MAISRNEFAATLSRSGIMTEEQLAAFESKLPADRDLNNGESLAQELVREYRLTEYQRNVLCRESSGPLSLDNYVILDKIGEGGMGVVFKAIRRAERSVVALKVLPPKLIDDESAIRRFQREVELAARLTHPNIVTALGSGTVEEQLYFVMEFVDGKNISAIVKQQKSLAVLTAFDYVAHAARGLAYAHEKGVIHRDIKPANLLLDRDGTVKILDMGLARVKSNSDEGDSVTLTDLTLSGTVLGTADYMSPEQALNAKRADHRSDIYSLGCTMHFIFTGKPIYEGETMMEKLVAHREHPVPSLMDRRDDVPSGVDEIFRKMVAKDPDDRYASATEVVNAMQDCREEYGNMWMIRRFIDEQKGRRY